MRKKEHIIKGIKTPWPTKNAMEQIYEKNLWGVNADAFYSGDGSHHPDVVKPYIESVTSFLSTFESPLIVCDLGCGDFNVGKALVKHTSKYIAVDIVEGLIVYNKEKFIEKDLEFYCLDIAVDNLPSGDCAVLRQVLQHLSNAEVELVVRKLTDFKYIILTEHLPEGDFTPNKDIISGQGIRLKKQSGLSLLVPPFNLKVKEEEQLLSVTLDHSQGVIVTTLYEMF